ncbi:MAG: hypothetical protein KGJ98_09605 [Chloroflexota bacterium]|nr:hypothetical protein [Chloroflexota bacterium]MDE3102479.1 hypothetical protein [Chloroflexota bacterium]
MDDRERIGRELHDGAIQSLFAVGLELQATRSRAPDPIVKRQLANAVARIDDVIRDLRGYISELRPDVRDEPSLEQSLERLAVEFEERSGVLTVSEIDARVARELDAVASDVVMMAREALARVGRHSGATTCRLRLRRADNEVIFDVSDDGGGPDRDRSRGNAPDAPVLHERAASIGATRIVGGRGGSGDVEIHIPLPPSARAP